MKNKSMKTKNNRKILFGNYQMCIVHKLGKTCEKRLNNFVIFLKLKNTN